MLALPAGEVHAQTIGQEACPDGVMQIGFGSLFVVNTVTHDRARLQGVAPISATDIESLASVTGRLFADWDNATLYTGVRGYGYAADARDARSFRNTIVQVEDGDLIHGAWLHAGRIIGNGLLTPSPSTFHSLQPSTRYVAQLVVGELRKQNGDVVTNNVVSGTANSVGKKPKPVLAQVCFRTAASPS